MRPDPQMPSLDVAARRTIAANLAVTGLVLLLMMLVGLLLRLTQAGWLGLEPDLFYQFMTVHGVGMVGIAALGGASVMWYFLSQYVRLNSGVLAANLVLFLIGVVMILGADLIGGFAAGWTFLYPLPARSSGVWGTAAAAWHLGGLLLIGVGFLLVCLEIGRALVSSYGGLGRSLGWPQLFGTSMADPPPPTVVASTMVVIVTTLALVAGATIIVLSLVNLMVPSFEIDPLLAKNIIYFFGHVFINATIYMAVIAVYEILPRYTKRPWKSSRVFLAAWTASTTMVLVIFPHHLLMDLVMPRWTMVLGQVLSYTNSFPVLVVTGLGALAIVHRSGIRWDMVSGLLFLAMFGWMAGVVPAVVDATIIVNSVMHNTLWVPGHFHFYLLLGLVPMIFAFMYYVTADRQDATSEDYDRWALRVYIAAGLGFVVMFLYAGRHSVPRRWAVHLPEWVLYDQLASIFAVLVLLAAGLFVWRFLVRVPRLLAAG
ncbi:MAG: cbb3-type cytochrome c oxidase subunit I [Hyphomicrobiaceae bacterium]|nr:cbb3-type cytochrome c oxidase subunit I [Hyphomicrobiaceae bacterium]